MEYKDYEVIIKDLLKKKSSATDENRIVTILKNDFDQLSCDIFEFENGLIVREYKYYFQPINYYFRF